MRSHKQVVRQVVPRTLGMLQSREYLCFCLASSMMIVSTVKILPCTLRISDLSLGENLFIQFNELATKVTFQKSQSHSLTASKGAHLYLGETEIQKHLKWNLPSRKRCQFDSKSHPGTPIKTGAHTSV